MLIVRDNLKLNCLMIPQLSLATLICNLADPLVERLQNAIDLIVFNPPYVPTYSSELDMARSTRSIESSWAGGHDGMEVTNKLLEEIPVRT